MLSLPSLLGTASGLGAYAAAMRVAAAMTPPVHRRRLTPVIAAVTALSVSVRMPTPWAAPAFGAFAGVVVALSEIDLGQFRIPRRIVIDATIAGVVWLAAVSALVARWSAETTAVAAAVIVFTLFLLVHLVSPKGFGYGDVRMGGMCGLFMGWLGWRVALDGVLAALVLSGGVGGALVLFRRVPRTARIPFAPFLALGAVISIVLS